MSHIVTTALTTTLPVTGLFWTVISGISDSGSFPDRVSSKLGSAWHGSTTTLDAKRLWRCSWLSSVPQQQTPSSVPPLAYANYAMGSPQVGFFFRVESPTILYLIYVWCPFWCLLSTFRCPVGCHIHLLGLNN